LAEDRSRLDLAIFTVLAAANISKLVRRKAMSTRPVLSLGSARAAAAKPAVRAWKCKPCGARVEVAEGLAADEVIRCPACTANLGKAADFYAPTETFARLRARPAPDKPAPSPVPKVLVTRAAKKKIWIK
jgi:DNA-directed RNA polymerase subunit RPC12/RpoP